MAGASSEKSRFVFSERFVVCELVGDKKAQQLEPDVPCDSENPLYDFNHGLTYNVKKLLMKIFSSFAIQING